MSVVGITENKINLKVLFVTSTGQAYVDHFATHTFSLQDNEYFPMLKEVSTRFLEGQVISI